MENREKYNKLFSYLDYTLHELPVGVLFDANGANEEECLKLMKDTFRLEELSKSLDENIGSFIDFCRWHYERYPHNLSRQKHFASYGNYIVKYDGPLKFSHKVID